MDGEIIPLMGVYVKGISILEFLMQPPRRSRKALNLVLPGSLAISCDVEISLKISISIRGLVFFLLELHKRKLE
jgi:hypothetical protein